MQRGFRAGAQLYLNFSTKETKESPIKTGFLTPNVVSKLSQSIRKQKSSKSISANNEVFASSTQAQLNRVLNEPLKSIHGTNFLEFKGEYFVSNGSTDLVQHFKCKEFRGGCKMRLTKDRWTGVISTGRIKVHSHPHQFVKIKKLKTNQFIKQVAKSPFVQTSHVLSVVNTTISPSLCSQVHCQKRKDVSGQRR